MKKLCSLLIAMSFVSFCFAQKIDFDKKLKELNIELFTPGKPIANYVKAVRTGN
jgi:hypothetical protein